MHDYCLLAVSSSTGFKTKDVMKKNKLLAICLKTYPDEDDMRAYCEGEIEACDVKIYYKGRKYLVTKYCDKKYYKLLETE